MFANLRFSIILLCISMSAYAADTKSVLNIQRWLTANGAHVYFVHAGNLPMVDVQVVFNAGSARDANKAGLASLTNAMLDEGTSTMSADQIAQQFDQVGAIYNTSVDRDMAIVAMRSLADKKFLTPALQTFTDVLTQANFPQAAFQRNQRQALVAIQAQQQSPSITAQKAFLKAVYGNAPYAYPVLGEEDTVAALTPADLQNFYKQYYVAHNAIVVIVGDVDKTTAANIATQVTAVLATGKAAPALPLFVSTGKAINEHINFPSQQTTVYLGQIGITPTDTDYFPLLVGNYTLGGGMLVSRLIDQLREQRGLVYNANSMFLPLSARGLFFISLQTRNAQTQNAIDLSHSVLDTFIKTGPTDSELLAAKDNLIGGFPLSLASNAAIMNNVVNIAFYHLPLDYLDTYTANIKAVTPAKIRQAFTKHINLQALVTITVGQQVSNKKPSPTEVNKHAENS